MMSEHFYTLNSITLAEEDKNTRVEVLRVGTIQDRGLKITKEMLTDFVSNFKANVYGTELQVNLSHDRDGEAAGWIKEMEVEDERLFAEVEWTPLGLEKLKNKLFKFVSAEFADRFPHFETGKKIKNVFMGLALTNVPALKGQSPIALSQEAVTNLNNQRMLKKLLENLSAREIVLKEDKIMLRELFSELSEEEQGELTAEVEAVEAKLEEVEAPAEVPAEVPPEEAPAEEPKTEELTEKLTEQSKELKRLAEQNKKLHEKIEQQELSELFDESFALTEENEIGLLADSKSKVVSFLMGLSPAQRDGFKEIVGEVRTADLSVYGSTKTIKMASEDSIVELAEQLVKEGKAKSIGEAQKMAMEQLKK